MQGLQTESGQEISEEAHLLGLLSSDRALRWKGKPFDADPALTNLDSFDPRTMDRLVKRGFVRVTEHQVGAGAATLLAYKLSSRGNQRAEQLLRSLRLQRHTAERATGGGR